MQTQQQTATAQVRVKRKYTKRKPQLRLVTSAAATAQAQAAANATTNATAKRNSALHTQRMLNFATAQNATQINKALYTSKVRYLQACIAHNTAMQQLQAQITAHLLKVAVHLQY
jgi:hypothetical protein